MIGSSTRLTFLRTDTLSEMTEHPSVKTNSNDPSNIPISKPCPLLRESIMMNDCTAVSENPIIVPTMKHAKLKRSHRFSVLNNATDLTITKTISVAANMKNVGFGTVRTCWIGGSTLLMDLEGAQIGSALFVGWTQQYLQGHGEKVVHEINFAGAQKKSLVTLMFVCTLWQYE